MDGDIKTWKASWTPERVGEWFGSFGSAYTIYKQMAIDNGIRGAILARMKKMPREKAEQMLRSVGLTNEFHLEVLLSAIFEDSGDEQVC